MAGTPIMKSNTDAENKIKKVKAIKAVKDKFVVDSKLEFETQVSSDVVVEVEKKKRGGKKVAKKVEAEESVVEGSQEAVIEGDDNVKKDKPKKNLPAKYNKLMVFGYWLIENISKNNVNFAAHRPSDSVTQNTPNASEPLGSSELLNLYRDMAFQQLQMFSTLSDQVLMFENFFGDFKSTQKIMRAAIRVHNKPPKQKKTKNTGLVV